MADLTKYFAEMEERISNTNNIIALRNIRRELSESQFLAAGENDSEYNRLIDYVNQRREDITTQGKQQHASLLRAREQASNERKNAKQNEASINNQASSSAAEESKDDTNDPPPPKQKARKTTRRKPKAPTKQKQKSTKPVKNSDKKIKK